MPSLTWSQSIAAGATFNPLTGWAYEFAPRPGVVKYLHKATATGLVATIRSGSDELLQEAPVPAGGTAGTTPTDFTAPAIIDRVAAGDRQAVNYRNPTGGAITIDGILDYTPTH
jgi:hypothetical protein